MISLHRCQAVAVLCAALLLALPSAAQPAQPAPPGAPVNRLMDIWPGAVFVCVPDPRLKWSFPACEAIAEEALHLAESGKFRLAVAGTPKSPDVKGAARQAGLDSDIALSIVATFSGESGNGTLLLEATSRVDAKPGVTQPLYRKIFVQSALLRGEATTNDAIATGKSLLEGLVEWLLRPVKR